jgi:hypothetical protein
MNALAKFRNSHRGLQARVPALISPRPCNDNHAVPRLVASSPRRAKPILVSRWHVTAAGKLECEWCLEIV